MRKIYLLFLIIFTSITCGIGQSNFHSDTVYSRYNKKAIQSITTKEGNKTTIRTYHISGNLASEEFIIDSLKEGKHLFWYDNGQVRREHIYVNDLCMSIKEWYDNGQMQSEEHYIKAKYDVLVDVKYNKPINDYYTKLDGKYLKYYKSGGIQTSGNYKAGARYGKWIEYYETGSKRSEITYKNDVTLSSKAWYTSGKLRYVYHYAQDTSKRYKREIKNGEQITYFENGKMSEHCYYVFGKKNGLYELWYESGLKKQETNYKLDHVDGINKTWESNGNLSQYTESYDKYDSIRKYHRTIYHGTYQTYYNNGNKKSIGKYIHGKEDGLFTNYFLNGIKSSEVMYKNGQKIGKATYWNDNNIIRTVENYVLKKDTFCSVKDGEQLIYAENGNLIEKGNYVMGYKEGQWLIWYENGQLMESRYFKHNLPNGEVKTYDKDGKISSMIQVDSAHNTLNNKMDYLKTHFEYYKTSMPKTVTYYNGDHVFKRIQYYENNTNNEIQYHINLKNTQAYSSTDFLYSLKFHNNGKLKELEILYHSHRVGRVLKYYYNGNLKSLTDYDVHGRAMDYDLFWASDGSVLKALYKDSTMRQTDTLINHFYTLYNKTVKQKNIDISRDADRLANPAARSFFKYEFGEHVKLNLFYPNGNKMVDCFLENQKAYGPFKIYHANGNVFKEETEHFGKYNDTSYSYYPSGFKSFMEISLNNKSIEKREWYDSGQIKMLAFYLDNKMHGTYTLWYPNGKIESESTYDSGINIGYKNFHKNGQLKSSSYFTTSNLKHQIIESFNINGIKTQYEEWENHKQNGPYLQWWNNGKPKTVAWYKNGKSDSTWTFYNEDGSFNKEIQYKNGYSLKSFSQLECECLDTTSSRISYAPGLKDLVSQTKLREWSFNFHAPIDEYLNRLFYKNLQFNNNDNASFASFDLLSFEKLNIKIPNYNGLELCLNPCYTKANSISSVPFMVNVNTKDKAQTRVSIYPKYLSIQFSKNLFHRWDTSLLYKNKQVNEYSNTARQFDVYLPSPLLFKAKEIRYNKDAHFEVSNASDICFPKSEIGHSGVSIDFNDFVLDLDISRNPYQIEALSFERYGNYYYYGEDEYESTYSRGSSRGYGDGGGRGSYGTNNPGSYGKKESALSKFVGIFIDSAQLGFPKDVFNTDTNMMVIGRNTLIENNYIIASFAIKAKVGAALFYEFKYKGKDYSFIPKSVENKLKEKGFYSVFSEYDNEKSEYVFYIYFKAN